VRKDHRGVLFDVHELPPDKWEWIAYPRIGQGVKFGGEAPTEAEATKAAQLEIDERLK
jgi:hypothetical protein